MSGKLVEDLGSAQACVHHKFAQLAGLYDFNGLGCAEYTCEMIAPFGPTQLASGAIGSSAALALLDERQNGSD